MAAWAICRRTATENRGGAAVRGKLVTLGADPIGDARAAFQAYHAGAPTPA